MSGWIFGLIQGLEFNLMSFFVIFLSFFWVHLNQHKETNFDQAFHICNLETNSGNLKMKHSYKGSQNKFLFIKLGIVPFCIGKCLIIYVTFVNPIPHGVFWITHTWGGQILPTSCNTAILKDMDLKFGMLQ